MSRFSGKCDFYDTICISGIEHVLNCEVYIGNSDIPLNLTCIEDCVPYFPHIVSIMAMDNVKKTGIIRLTEKSWVDIEEKRYGPMKMHQYYREALQEEIKKAKGED